MTVDNSVFENWIEGEGIGLPKYEIFVHRSGNQWVAAAWHIDTPTDAEAQWWGYGSDPVAATEAVRQEILPLVLAAIEENRGE